MKGLGEGQGLYVEQEERHWRQRTNNSFAKFCCKGRVMEENRVNNGLFFFFSMREITCLSFLGKIFQHREKSVDILITTNIY